MRLAIFAITENGIKIANRIKERIDDEVEIFTPPKAKGSKSWIGSIVKEVFPEFDGLIFISAVGIAVRAIAPHLRDKTIDPAVVVVDDAGAFSISLLSGHIGGANDLARKIGDTVGAMPVITTATDIAGKPAIDLLMKDLGLKTRDKAALKRISAAILRGETACIFADIGLGRWGDRARAHYSVRPLSHLEKYGNAYENVVIIEDDTPVNTDVDALVLKTRRVFAGIGCRKGIRSEEVKRAIRAALASKGLHMHNLKGLASIEHKSDEQGLLEATRHLNVGIHFYSAEELEKVSTNKSDFVKDKVGAGAVCEPAAILASKGGKLIVPKTIYGKVTVALAEEV
ncbi:MAG: cobalt-precorrin 5A hydrolase [Actinomycetota bacterium]|nr:cobalt-precorrin 5A hydrolase [Actinomycetota bacterium]